MKCDELKPIFIPTRGITGDTLLGVGYYPSNAVDAAIAELKTKLEEEREFGLNRAKSADHEIGKMCVEFKELKAENHKLRRALYKACANWARSERYTEATWHGDEHREELWANVQAKCLNKAEEYK